jgi:hypothetical protein
MRGEVVFQHAWLLFVLFTCGLAGVWWFRGRKYRQAQPELTEGYRDLVKGLLLWGNVPWILMGILILTGKVGSVFDFHDLRTGNPYIWLWNGVLYVLVWGFGTNWVFHGGAEALVEHPGLLDFKRTTPRVIKVWWLVCLAGGVLGLVLEFVKPDVAHF